MAVDRSQAECLARPKSRTFTPAGMTNDVVRLQIAMNDVFRVRNRQSAGDLETVSQSVLKGHAAFLEQ